MRQKFITDELDTHKAIPRLISRKNVYSDVMAIYYDNAVEILKEFPFRVQFESERAVDTGGVSRDMFSSFWEEAYRKNFDGESLLVPAVHPNSEISTFSVLGTILAHGFIVCGFLPVRIAFPVLAAIFHGPNVEVPDTILLESFVDYLSCHESSLIHEAIKLGEKGTSFSSHMQADLINTLSRLGCTEIPSFSNIKRLVITISKHLLVNKPLGTLYTLRSGVPIPYHNFLKQFSIQKLFELYKALNATSASVLRLIESPEDMNFAEDRVFRYLLTFVGSAKTDQLRFFLRFVTGSSVLIDERITISFNNLTGLARRPISHTCDCGLELPISYATYPEFEFEFSKILSHEMSWVMDAI